MSKKIRTEDTDVKLTKMIAYCKSPDEYDLFDYRTLRPKYFVEKFDEHDTVDDIIS